MIEFLLLPDNIPFAAALAFVCLIVTVELLLMLTGVSLSDAVDSVLPDFDLINPLSWLGFGKAPTFIVLITIATLFGVCGFLVQGALDYVGIGTINPEYAAGAALIAALPVTRRATLFLARVLPGDETYVGCRNSLVGSIGTLTQGDARNDLPAECRLPDGHGGSLYVQVVPDGSDVIAEGSRVIVIRKDNHRFVVVPFCEER